jgi:hypothetical protein
MIQGTGATARPTLRHSHDHHNVAKQGREVASGLPAGVPRGWQLSVPLGCHWLRQCFLPSLQLVVENCLRRFNLVPRDPQARTNKEWRVSYPQRMSPASGTARAKPVAHLGVQAGRNPNRCGTSLDIRTQVCHWLRLGATGSASAFFPAFSLLLKPAH